MPFTLTAYDGSLEAPDALVSNRHQGFPSSAAQATSGLLRVQSR